MNCEGYAVGTYAGKKEIAEAGRVKGKVAVKGKVGESLQSNLNTYGNEYGMSIEQALKKYGSYEEIIDATIKSNPGMDACTGLYDIYHGGK